MPINTGQTVPHPDHPPQIETQLKMQKLYFFTFLVVLCAMKAGGAAYVITGEGDAVQRTSGDEAIDSEVRAGKKLAERWSSRL
jgi:hypothetical protein